MAHFTDTATWRLLIKIDTDVEKSQNELSGAREPKVPDDSVVQVPGKHDFSETFEKGNFIVNLLVKVDCIIFVNNLCKLQSHNVF